MKVNIGPYRNGVFAYQLLGDKFYERFPEEKADRVEIVIQKVLDWTINLFYTSKRKVYVKIHNYDTFNADNTLAHIIHPMLIQLKKTKHGYPQVELEDVPVEHQKEIKEGNLYVEEHWDYILDEMIWAFGEIKEEYPNEPWQKGQPNVEESYRKYWDRIFNGTRLFGVYYNCLWD